MPWVHPAVGASQALHSEHRSRQQPVEDGYTIIITVMMHVYSVFLDSKTASCHHTKVTSSLLHHINSLCLGFIHETHVFWIFHCTFTIVLHIFGRFSTVGPLGEN